MTELFERPRIIRPPSEAESYFLPLTAGCSNHSCTFCNYFYGSKLRLRELDEVKKEIDALALFQESGIGLPGIPDIVFYLAQQWDGRKIFLQDGDALVYPFPRLKEVLSYLNKKFPELDRIGTYATPQDLLRISPEQLKTLKELKLGIIYMGVESGDDEILRRIGKGVNHEQIIEAGKKARAAGITLSVTVILGLGGIKESAGHAMATARVLNSIDPEYAGALTITLVPGTPLYQDWKQGNFILMSPLESLKELKMIIENSDFSNCFFSSMHASNYLPIRGTLPGDKPRMIALLQQVIEKDDPSVLRPEYLRGL